MSATPSERIDYLIKELAGGNAAEFARNTGISESSVSKIVHGNFGYGKNGIGPYFERIMKAYPDVNPLWLATGDGKPLVPRPSVETIDSLIERVDDLARKLQQLLDKQG